MGGPSAHGQRNKAHKAGRMAGKSAREKHRAKKEAGGGAHRQPIKATSATTKAERALASKQSRDAKRQQVLERRRREGAPLVAALLPLSDEADTAALWQLLHAALAPGAGAGAGGMHASHAKGDAMDVEASDPQAIAAALGMRPHTAVVQGRSRLRLTLLPPPRDRADPLAYVDLGRAADVLLLALPAGERAATVDAEGALAMRILRAMGLPTCVGLVISGDAGSPSSAAPNMKERSAARRRAEKALGAHLPGEQRLFAADSAADAQQLLRHLADASPTPPLWRRQRPAVVVQEASFSLDPSGADNSNQQQQQEGGQAVAGPLGTLRLTGYVRGAGLSANQLITVPGAGDFRLLAVEGPTDPAASLHARGGDADMADGSGGAKVLAEPDPDQQDDLIRENAPDPLLGEQTWPTDEELRDAELAAAAAAAARARRRRKLPPGTSDYQAAWIFDDMSGGESDLEEGEEEEEEEEEGQGEEEDMAPAAAAAAGGSGGAMEADGGGSRGGGAAALRFDEEGAAEDLDYLGEDDCGTDGALAMALDDEEEEEGEGGEAARARARAAREEVRRRRQAEAEDVEYPDEVEVPDDITARERFARYRGLKSLRSSPWDPREGTPADYERVFAFENFKRTHKRAKEAAARATAGTDPCSVPPGSYVTLVLAAVPAAAASAVLQRVADFAAGQALPLTAFGLMQHESKLSVVNFSLRKAAEYDAPIANKEELLFVTGLRGFTARPVLSGDDTRADKHKMERFLHTGRHLVATVYAPISYGPLPLLAFKAAPGRRLTLAATGALRSVDPDRVVLKKIVLTGYPARVHKSKAVVRFMFRNPDDVRWFKPVELWTKAGRRGRITEPLGTHGAFKARFDGPVQQRDAVCLSLYKRAFPKWPADTTAFSVV